MYTSSALNISRLKKAQDILNRRTVSLLDRMIYNPETNRVEKITMGRHKLPSDEKKVSHHFKLSPQTKLWLENKSKKLGIGKTKYIEDLIEADNTK